MQRRRILMVVAGSGLGVALALAPRASKGDDMMHGGGMGDHMQMKPSATEPIASVWRSVKKREAELADLVKAKQLDKVHETAFAIRDLVAAMPEKSTGLKPEQNAKLAGNVKFVATLAQRLDAAGDAKDQAGTEGAFKQLQGVLSGIEGLYPAGTLE